MSFTPRTIGPYQVLGSLGAGGMAEVLLGRMRGTGGFERVVALKVLLPELVDIDGTVDMLLDEARLAASIRHPNVAQVHELLDADHCIVMEYLAGQPLSRVLGALRKVGRPISPALACHIIAESCAGIHAAHEHKDSKGQSSGLVHRDISPQNLFVTYDGAVKVLDFGVARATGRRTHTQVGFIKGKTEYMSPEQSLGLELDRRSDVFSIGIVLWEMLTGRSLFRSSAAMTIAEAVMKDPPVAPGRVATGIPAALDAVVMKALAQKTEDRFADAAQMRRELLKAAGTLPLDGPADEVLARLMRELFTAERAEKEALLLEAGVEPSPPARRSTRTWTAVFVAALLVGFGVVMGVKVMLSAPAPEPKPQLVVAAAPVPAPIPERVPVPAPVPVAVTPDPLPTKVKIEISTVPSGAEVKLNRRAVGRSPVTLELARDSKALELIVQRVGSATVEQSLVPDRDQRLLLQLPAAPRRHRAPGEKDPLDQKW